MPCGRRGSEYNFFVLNSLVPYRLVREGAKGECTNVNILFNTDMLTFSNKADGNKTWLASNTDWIN